MNIDEITRKTEQPVQEELKDAVMIVSLFLFHLKIAPKKSASVSLKNPALCGPIDTHTWMSWLKPGARPNHAILKRFTLHLANKYAVIRCWAELHNDSVDVVVSSIEGASRILTTSHTLQHQPWQCLYQWYSNNNDSIYQLLKCLNNENLLHYLDGEKDKLDGAIKGGFNTLYEILYQLSNVYRKNEDPKLQKEIILEFIKKECQKETEPLNQKGLIRNSGDKNLFAKVSIALIFTFIIVSSGYYLYPLSLETENEESLVEQSDDNSLINFNHNVFASNVDVLRKQRIVSEVERIRSSSPQIISEPVHNRLMVESVPKPTITGVELIDYWVIWDLRDLKQLSSLDRTKMLSPAVQRIRQRVKKTEDLSSYRLPAYTSGIDIFSRSNSLPLTVYASDERNKIAEYTVKPRMLEFDVSNIATGDEFILDVTKTYWNAFQGVDQSWVGITTELPTLSIHFLVIFPDDRPYKQLDYFASDKDKNRIDVKDSKHVIKDKNKTWVSWHIVNPKAHHGYHIDWEW